MQPKEEWKPPFLRRKTRASISIHLALLGQREHVDEMLTGSGYTCNCTCDSTHRKRISSHLISRHRIASRRNSATHLVSSHLISQLLFVATDCRANWQPDRQTDTLPSSERVRVGQVSLERLVSELAQAFATLYKYCCRCDSQKASKVAHCACSFIRSSPLAGRLYRLSFVGRARELFIPANPSRHLLIAGRIHSLHLIFPSLN